MAITDPAAIRYSNEELRPAADRLARCYYRGGELLNDWQALLVTNDEKVVLLKDKLESTANLFRNTYLFIFNADRIWNSNLIANIIPNDPLELLYDNEDGTGQDPNRGPLTGQDCRRVKLRMEEFNNWMSRGTDVDLHFVTDAVASLAVTDDFLDHVYRVTSQAVVEPSTYQNNIFVTSRIANLINEYEVDHPANLNHILRAAVNPGEVE